MRAVEQVRPGDELELRIVRDEPLGRARPHAAERRAQHAGELQPEDLRRRLGIQPGDKDDACARQLTAAPMNADVALGIVVSFRKTTTRKENRSCGICIQWCASATSKARSTSIATSSA